MTDHIHSVRDQLRGAMPVAEKWAYFDHAAVAPISQPASAAMAIWLAQAAEDGDTVWPQWSRQISATRSAAARLVGATEAEIALLPNTTAGINLVAEGLDWRTGDNVVTLDDEFPTNLYPWMHLADRGVETRQVPTEKGHVTADKIASHCDSRTRVVSVSWVSYSNGNRRRLRPIADVAHAHNALFLVDAIQGLGVFPLNVNADGIDVLSADGHKWLLAPEGAGIAYLNQDAFRRLRPTGIGWNSVVQGGNFDRIALDIKPTAARYEGGTCNTAGFIGLGASLSLLLDLGVENVADCILEFHDLAVREVTALGAVLHSPTASESRSGILSFELPGRDPLEVRRTCVAQGVAINCRGGRLRVSAHAYNDSADLERLLRAISHH